MTILAAFVIDVSSLLKIPANCSGVATALSAGVVAMGLGYPVEFGFGNGKIEQGKLTEDARGLKTVLL